MQRQNNFTFRSIVVPTTRLVLRHLRFDDVSAFNQRRQFFFFLVGVVSRFRNASKRAFIFVVQSQTLSYVSTLKNSLLKGAKQRLAWKDANPLMAQQEAKVLLYPKTKHHAGSFLVICVVL